MKPYEVEDLRDGYVELVKMVRDEGQVVKPRGYKTWEIEDATFTVRDTRRLLPLGVGRELNVDIGAAEALTLCAGIYSPSLMTNVTENFRMFLDGGQFHGAYGPRVRPQLDSVVRRLRSDRDSRQAIITIWDPLHDGMDNVRDLPCTLSLGFRLRHDELHLSATMRSNDIWLGLGYDAFQFGQLGHTVARALDVPFGSYTHHAYSLHLYERNSDDVDKLHAYDAAPPEANGYWEPSGFGWSSLDYEGNRVRAEFIYRGKRPPAATMSEGWYLQRLSKYDRLTRKANFSS